MVAVTSIVNGMLRMLPPGRMIVLLLERSFERSWWEWGPVLRRRRPRLPTDNVRSGSDPVVLSDYAYRYLWLLRGGAARSQKGSGLTGLGSGSVRLCDRVESSDVEAHRLVWCRSRCIWCGSHWWYYSMLDFSELVRHLKAAGCRTG